MTVSLEFSLELMCLTLCWGLAGCNGRAATYQAFLVSAGVRSGHGKGPVAAAAGLHATQANSQTLMGGQYTPSRRAS
jgi:hypothetical protein